MTHQIVRRCLFWLLLVIGVTAWILFYLPMPLNFEVAGTAVGGNAIPFAIGSVAMSLLLLWSAVYVRVEPMLVRLALLVIGIPLCWSAVRDFWSTLMFLIYGPPSSP